MKRSTLRASAASPCLVGICAFALFIACDSDSSEVEPGDDTSAGEAPSGGTASGGSNAMGGSKPQAGTSANGGSPEPVDDEGGAPGQGGSGVPAPGGAADGGASADNGGGGVGGEPACVPEPPELPSDVPAGIVVAEGATLLRSLHAVGTQNYRCTETPGEAGADPTFGWVFVAPVADLFNSCGTKVGSHFKVEGSDPPAPEWKYEIDGSSVIGLRLSAAPVVGAIPELLLKEDGHRGAGVFAGVTFVQRLRTVGGLAPDVAECTADNVDEVVEIAYSAQYYFYTGGT